MIGHVIDHRSIQVENKSLRAGHKRWFSRR
jgi:hypothetical protein